jgi:hypothetical protein
MVHDRSMLIFVAFGAASGLGAALYAWLVSYKRRLTAIRATIPPTLRAVGAHWQAGRWDADARHAYVANLGDDTAYDVTVVENERVIATAPSVPPFSADRFRSTTTLPCYVNFCVHSELDARPPLAAAGRPQRGRRTPVSISQSRIAVQVSWRTERGEWSTHTVRSD